MPGDPSKMASDAPNPTTENKDKSISTVRNKSYKTLYGRPFLNVYLLLDEELNQNVKFVTSLANFQAAISKHGLELVTPTTTTPLYQESKF